MATYKVNGIEFSSIKKAIEYARRVCGTEQRKVSVWVDGEREARATFCRTSEGAGGVYRAEPDCDDAVEVEVEPESEIELVIVTSDCGTIRRTAESLDRARLIRDEWSRYTTTIAINATEDGSEVEELTYER